MSAQWWIEPKPGNVEPVPGTVECGTCGSWSGRWPLNREGLPPRCPACKTETASPLRRAIQVVQRQREIIDHIDIAHPEYVGEFIDSTREEYADVYAAAALEAKR